MLQAHSPLWYYLWLAPYVLQSILAFLIWRRKLYRQYPVFLIFVIVTAVEQFTLYAADVLPSVSPTAWWKVFWVGLLVEALIKCALIGEIFGAVFGRYPSLARLGKRAIAGVGAVLVLAAAAAAAYAPIDNPRYALVSHAHILQQTVYMIECGLLLFIFLFASYFRLT